MKDQLHRLARSARLWQFARFCLVGGSGVVVDMVALHFLAEPKWLGWNVSVAKIFAAEIAMLNNFLWNDLWTFRPTDQSARTASGTFRRLLMFNLICGVGIVWAVLLLNLFYRGLGWNLYVANFAAIVLVTLWNFWMNAKFNWRVKAPSGQPDDSPQK